MGIQPRSKISPGFDNSRSYNGLSILMEYFRHLCKGNFQYFFVGILVLLMSPNSEAQILPKPDPEFQGKIDLNPENAIPNWPELVTAPEGAPNIVLILLDDVGFSSTSTFGGLSSTPVLDRLASEGLRYNRFNGTPMCSPTRAALLSGRNSHQVGFGRISEFAAGYPGYNSIWPKSAASMAEVLKLNGYSTAAFGKWHNTPVWEATPAGPFDRWPTGLGFEYFYGFIGYGSSQWEPNLYRNTIPVSAPADTKEGYNLTTDLANDAIMWIERQHAASPTKPFFLYFAASATHSPHHVPREWVDKYKGKFDQGWDKLREETFKRQKELGIIPQNAVLNPRPEELAAWESLSPEQKKLLARQMEVYSAYIAHTDYEIGRMLNAIRDAGKMENTIVIYIADDNGPTTEGGFDGRDALTVQGKNQTLEERLHQHDAIGSVAFDNAPAAAWAWASNSPFKGAKTVASDLGGVRLPMVVSWPSRIRETGGIRSQFIHIIDIAPTLFEIASIRAPRVVHGIEQMPLEGRSFAYTFEHTEDSGRTRVQYFEVFGSRGIYAGGWWAGSPNGSVWNQGGGTPIPPPDQRPWELYNLNQDYSQAYDLAKQYPEKLEELKTLFDSEAQRNNVYPLELPFFGPQPSLKAGRSHFVYHQGSQRIPSAAAPSLAGQAHKITAEVTIPDSGAEGVIVAQGGRHGGFTLYIKDGRLIYETSAYGHLAGSLESSMPISPGKLQVIIEVSPVPSNEKSGGFRQSFPMKARLIINEKEDGEMLLRSASDNGTLDVGNDLVSPVSPNYECPNTFTGRIESVTIDLL
jgi:arylsulfatase A-like enzyme